MEWLWVQVIYNYCAMRAGFNSPHMHFANLTFQGTKLDLLLYIADNMAHFPYSIQEEPLFVIHHIDTILSVTGTNLLHSFKEVGSL